METMIQSKNICYKGYVPTNYEKKEAGIGTRVPDSMKRELDAIAHEHDRPAAYVIRELLTRGQIGRQIIFDKTRRAGIK